MSIHVVFKSPSKADVAVVFLHGLNVSGASAHWRDTWRPEGLAIDDHGWPAWLGQDLATRGVATNVYAVRYPSHALKWKGATMPMFDQAGLVLEELDLGLAGESQIYFVCYSLGGLVLKKMLGVARGRDTSKVGILARTKGMVFLSTPHQGAKIAEVVNFWLKSIGRTTITIAELEQSNPGLRELYETFKYQSSEYQWTIYQYGEARPTSGVLVVDQWSAHSGVGDPPVSLDEDHLSICKVRDHGAIVFQRTRRMIETGAAAKVSAAAAAPPRADSAAAVAQAEATAVGTAPTAATTSRRFVVELDLVGYSDIASELERQLGVDAVLTFNRQIEDFIRHGVTTSGSVWDEVVHATTGDGAILHFSTADVAFAFGRAVLGRSTAFSTERRVRRLFRIGVAYGPVHKEGKAMAGSTIATAVRLEAAAAHGSMLFEEAAYDELPSKLAKQFSGPITVRGKREESYTAYVYPAQTSSVAAS